MDGNSTFAVRKAHEIVKSLMGSKWSEPVINPDNTDLSDWEKSQSTKCHYPSLGYFDRSKTWLFDLCFRLGRWCHTDDYCLIPYSELFLEASSQARRACRDATSRFALSWGKLARECMVGMVIWHLRKLLDHPEFANNISIISLSVHSKVFLSFWLLSRFSSTRILGTGAHFDAIHRVSNQRFVQGFRYVRAISIATGTIGKQSMPECSFYST
jgi:hypothetical protein